jgi:hypothetical protein
MEDHISDRKAEMFSESCDEVKTLLLSMCEHVEVAMTARTDDVFISMQRDYMEVISGTSLPRGEVMPRWERKMRAGVAQVIEERDTTATEDHEKAAVEISRMRRGQDRAGSEAGDDPEGSFSSIESDQDTMIQRAASTEGKSVKPETGVDLDAMNTAEASETSR